jgi:hypothetical protein
LAAQDGGAGRDTEQGGLGGFGGVGPDRLGGAEQRDAEHLVERAALDVLSRQGTAELGGAPHGDDGERLAVGQGEALHAQHLLLAEHAPHALGRHGEGELDDPPLGMATAALELVLDRAEVLEALTHGLGRDEPAEALARRDQALLAHDLEGAAHRHPAGAEADGQRRLARQQRTGRARRRQLAQLGGDLLVADRPHRADTSSRRSLARLTRSCQHPRAEGLSDALTCIRVVYIEADCKPPRHHMHKGNS